MAKYWSGRNREEEEEEEEALSLSDLPIDLAKAEETQVREESDGEEEGSSFDPELGKEEPEFDFGWRGSNGPCGPPESHMCAADELFFKGQILPLRLSVGSDNGLVCRSMSRSESMDHGSVSRFIGSRSSSIGSYHSSSSSSTNSSSATARADHHKPPLINHPFHTHPSPKPRSLNAGSTEYRPSSLRSTQGRFSLWDFFRTGLVRGPGTEIELQDLKFRSSGNNKKHSAISRNSSSNSNSNAESGSKSKRARPGSLFHRNMAGLLGGVDCKCSVETVALNVPITNMGPAPVGNVRVRTKSARTGGVEDKLPRNHSKTSNRERMKMKTAMSRRRTGEWLKELSLSHAKLS